MADDEDSVWEDEDMISTPIYGLYGDQKKGRLVQQSRYGKMEKEGAMHTTAYMYGTTLNT